jgi:hypothetical protein
VSVGSHRSSLRRSVVRHFPGSPPSDKLGARGKRASSSRRLPFLSSSSFSTDGARALALLASDIPPPPQAEPFSMDDFSGADLAWHHLSPQGDGGGQPPVPRFPTPLYLPALASVHHHRRFSPSPQPILVFKLLYRRGTVVGK